MSVKLYLSLTSSPSSPRVAINVPQEATGADLRKLSSEATSVPLATMKLIYRGRVIANKETGEVLKEFKLENDSVIHVMGKPAASAAAAEPTPSSSSTATTTTAGASVTPVAATAATAAPATNNDASPLASALMTLRTSNSNDAYRTALTTADKLLKNIVNHPMEEKYRTIKKSNPAFNKRLGGVTGGEALLLASGFTIETVDGNQVYVLRPSAQAWPRLVAAGEEVASKVAEINTQPSNNFAAPSIPAPAPSNNAFGGMPGMGGMSGDMNATMQQMMNDPNMMQNMMGMMNNPMVQNMMRNDPRFANNPMAQQALDELQRNPEMISQVTQMMSDPTMRANMSRMMEQQQQQQSGAGGGANPFGGGGGGGGGADEMRRQMEQFQRMSQQFGGGGAGAPSASNQNGNNQTNNNNQSDGEMTEEEMIAEAIRRSLGES